MPRKRIFREDILNAAVGLVREEGPAALSVRNIAKNWAAPPSRSIPSLKAWRPCGKS